MRPIIFLFALSISIIANAQWQKATGPSGGTVSAIASKGNKIFAAVGQSKSTMYISLDSGQTWDTTAGKALGSISCIEITASGRIVLGGNYGIQYSDNDGNNWSSSLLNNKKVRAIATKDSTVFVATYDQGLYKMSNDMQSFKLIVDSTIGLDGTTYLRSIYWTGDTIAIGIYGFGQYCMLGSYDDGNNWDTLAKLPEIAYAIISKNNRWFVKTRNGLYYADTVNSKYTQCNLPSEFGSSSGFENVLVNSGNALYLSGDDGVCKSGDNGITWTYIATNLINKSVTQIIKNNGTIIIATSGGIYKTKNEGTNWNKTDNGIYENDITEFEQIGNTILAATLHDGVYYSSDYGINWTQSDGITRGSEFVTFSKENNIIFCINNQGIIYNSNDEGKNWIFFDSSKIYNQNYYKRSFLYSQGKLYTSDNNGRLYIADTSKLIWGAVSMGNETYRLQKVGNIIYAAFKADGLYSSDDGGANWTLLQKEDFLYNSGDFVAYKNKVSLVGGYSKSIFYSTDSGHKWVQSLKTKDIYSSFINDGDTIFAGGLGSLYKSVDGFNWSEEKISVLNNIAINSIYYIDGTILLGTPIGIYYNNSNFNSINNIEQTHFSVYPNPVSDILYLSSDNKIKKIEIRNMLGQVVKSNTSVVSNSVDLSDLGSGVYIVSVVNKDGNSYQTKVLKQ